VRWLSQFHVVTYSRFKNYVFSDIWICNIIRFSRKEIRINILTAKQGSNWQKYITDISRTIRHEYENTNLEWYCCKVIKGTITPLFYQRCDKNYLSKFSSLFVNEIMDSLWLIITKSKIKLILVVVEIFWGKITKTVNRSCGVRDKIKE
jgi:hypothetical protein